VRGISINAKQKLNMSKYIVKRNFAKNSGMLYTGTIIEDVPEPFLTDWLKAGLIVPFDGSGINEIPASISTGELKLIRQAEGKPKNTKRK